MASEDLDDLLRCVREVFQQCRDNGITVNQDKLSIAKNEASFVGFKFSDDGIKYNPLYVIFRNSGSLGSRVCLLTNLGKILCSSKSQEIQMFCKQSCNLWFHTSLYMKLKNEQELSHWNSITTFLDTFKMQLMSFVVLPLDRICCYCYNIFLEENDNPEVCGINAYFVVQHTYISAKSESY